MVENGVCYQEDYNRVFNNEVSNGYGLTLSFKPRSSLARALYKKYQTDQYLSQIDKNELYLCDLDKLPENLRSKFVQLSPDEETVKFLQRSEEKSDWVPTQIWHSVATTILGWFMTQTSINGWLRRGSMFVLSMAQFLKLVRAGDEKWHRENLLDLGAGDGEVTSHLSPRFKETYVTEVSGPMRNLLQNRGYKLLEIDNWFKNGRKFDVISCLNLIDRCDNPNEILGQVKTSLKPDGFVLLAVVLPFSAYVEGTRDHKPKEVLPIAGSCFEEQVVSLVNDVLTPLGFGVVSWTRVPYLCEGDIQQSYYWLDDVILVLKVIDNNN